MSVDYVTCVQATTETISWSQVILRTQSVLHACTCNSIHTALTTVSHSALMVFHAWPLRDQAYRFMTAHAKR